MQRYTLFAVPLFLLAGLASAQQIWDTWTTSWDHTDAFAYSNKGPITFVAPGAPADAVISVDDTAVFQQIQGFGGSLTDNVALTLDNMKSVNAGNYWELLSTLFDASSANFDSAAFSFVRVNLGASDFSSTVYSLHDTPGDTALKSFDIDRAPAALFSVLQDILTVNADITIQLVPWSPPAWMKESGTMKGGALDTQYIDTYANYLLKSVQGFQGKGIAVQMIAIQNEPENSDGSYPTCAMPVATMAQVGTALRALLDQNALGAVQIIGYEHNWNDAKGYPDDLISQAGAAFAGVSFHCYEGSVSEQEAFHSAHPDKAIFFTECTGTVGSDYWSDIKWYMDNLAIGSVEHWSQSVAMWNIALDDQGNPKLPGTKSCGGGCRAIVSVHGDGSYTLNQEFFSLAHASKAVTPKDATGPRGKRLGVAVTGGTSWALRVGAYVTGRAAASDWLRYSLVVLNWYDNASSTFDPVPVTASIDFRGAQVNYTLPVGVTTLTWYAPNQGHS